MKRKKFYRRHLPHYVPDEADYHIVFRLSGSLPANVIQELRGEREEYLFQKRGNPNKPRRNAAALFRKFDSLLNNPSTGPRWLADPHIAEIVAEAIHYRNGKVYDLHAFTIMPNHVHLVAFVHQRDSLTSSLSDIMENLKWYTALKSNAVLDRRGEFWQHESYDHVVRSGEELERTIWYVLENPVKAGLVTSWEQWPWSYCKPEYLC